MTIDNRLTGAARLAVRIATLGNSLFLAAVVVALLLSLLYPPAFAGIIARALPGNDIAAGAMGMRLLMGLGIVMSIVTARLLAVLAAVVASVADPFIAANAVRLQQIGWCLLALQLCEIPAWLIARYVPAMGSAAPSGDVSIAGWMAVLMVFVLARVFAVGAAMRDDLAGTI